MGTGATEIADVPSPAPSAGNLLIRTTRSLISSGTERMLLEFGKAGPLEKARQQPDKVKMVLEKVRTDGLLPTIAAVRHKLDQPLAMGYCNVGRVLEVGAGISGFAVGDRVASNGSHAEIVRVPMNLAARIPDSVSDEEAAFTVVAAIGLQGIRLVQPTLGESVVVTGLGLIGLLSVQLLRAHGCRVLGIDPDPAKLEVARRFGAETAQVSDGNDVVAAATAFSRGRGVDAVLITAATTSNEPVHQAALMSRKRGRIVLVGVAGLELSRADFYEKELTFQVSCSYGPGRYDPKYERDGHDYPVGLVRWTEQRNFEAVLDMMADGRLDVRPLISHRFAFSDAARAYGVVGGAEPSLGIVLTYRSDAEATDETLRESRVSLSSAAEPRVAPTGARLGFVGAGNYATAVLIPAFKAAGAELALIASAGGASGVHAGRKFGFRETTTDASSVFARDGIHAVIVTTRHDSHARFVLQALAARRHVFVEKPLCLTIDELTSISAAHAQAPGVLLMVGFNRRFAPQVRKVKELLQGVSAPKSFVMTVNAGAIPPEHWTQDANVGGGRILGEACHFVDLLRFLADAPIVSHAASYMDTSTRDTVNIELRFADGSIGSIHYFANGSKAFPKERLEIFTQGRVLQLDNFRRLQGFGWPGFTSMNLWRQDKGQKDCAAAFVRALEAGGPAPISFGEIEEVSRVSIQLTANL